MQAFITKGCFTNHGGKIIEGDDSWLVDGKGVHLEGMGHFCPKCKVVSKALATQRGFIQVNGRNPIVAGDTATCGAKYMKISDLAVRGGGSGSASSSNQVSNLKDALKFDERVQLVDRDDNEPLAHVPYYLKNSKLELLFLQEQRMKTVIQKGFIQQKLKILIFISESQSDARYL